VPPRVEYVLEAQALKEAHDDPRWRRSSPEILLHDGVRNKREVIAIGGRKQRAVSTEALLSAVSRPSGGGSGRGLRFLAGVSRSGGTGSEAPGAGASAASKGDCFGQVEERPGRFGDAGAFAALRFIAGIMEGGPGHAGAAAASAFAGDPGAAADTVEKPGACGAASAGAALAGDRWVRQAGTAMAGAGEAAGEGTADASGVLAHDRLLYAGDRRAKPSTKCRGSERCAGAVADDDSGNRGLFGHAAAGRDWKHRALCRQSGVVQLRWTGAASAGVGGQGGARRNHAAGLTLLALDHGGSSPGGNALFAGGQGLLRTTAQEEARACGASGAGTKVIERGPCPVARWRGV